ncbi:hypothetical protein [Desulfobacter vibrioformis]|uniref:hypothetical protein n=1 Tax=Desulfobacter vibrioformis TaxID=34031 RepID=UPI00055646BE|nr:hypothetical protein [Desulfobacter vibrioformis]
MSDKTSSNRETQNVQKSDTNEQNIDICTSDPAWAEHARPNETGPEPCDDGRGIQFEKGGNS